MTAPSRAEAPVILRVTPEMPPATSSLVFGVVSPIPTLPCESIVSASVPLWPAGLFSVSVELFTTSRSLPPAMVLPAIM